MSAKGIFDQTISLAEEFERMADEAPPHLGRHMRMGAVLAREAVPHIALSPFEIQSNMSRVNWAEGLIRQLPEHHNGRNSWLLNYGNAPRPKELLAAAPTPEASQPTQTEAPRSIPTEVGIAWQAGAWPTERKAVTVDGHAWYRHDHPKLATRQQAKDFALRVSEALNHADSLEEAEAMAGESTQAEAPPYWHEARASSLRAHGLREEDLATQPSASQGEREAFEAEMLSRGYDDSEGSWKALPDRLRGRGDWLKARGRVRDAELMFDAATEIEGVRAALATQQAEASATGHIWGYAVRNPQEPAWPVEVVATKEHADRKAAMLYRSEVISLVAATQQAVQAPEQQGCAECGKTSTPDSMWALYCVKCIETKIAPALQAVQAEPVGKVCRDNDSTEFKIEWRRPPGPNGTLLYTATPRAPGQAELMPVEIDALVNASRQADEGPSDLVRRVWRAARASLAPGQVERDREDAERWCWYHEGDERVGVLDSEEEAHAEAQQWIDDNCAAGEEHEYLVAPMKSGLQLLPSADWLGTSILEDINNTLSDEMGAEEEPLDFDKADIAELGNLVRSFIQSRGSVQWWTIDTKRQTIHTSRAARSSEGGAA